jgi:uncharacterized protein YtpQ (UPF0354 family)
MAATYTDPNRLFTISLPDAFQRDEEASSLVFRHQNHDASVTVSCLRYEREGDEPEAPGSIFESLPSRDSMQNIAHDTRDGMKISYGDYVGELQNKAEAWRWWTLQRDPVAIVVSVNGSPDAVRDSRPDVDALVDGIHIAYHPPLSPADFTDVAVQAYTEVLGEEPPEIVKPLELAAPDGAMLRLENAYASYLDAHEDNPEVKAHDILLQVFEMLWGQNDENLGSFEDVQSMLYPVVRPWGFTNETKVPIIKRTLIENELETLVALDTGRTLRFISREDLNNWEGVSEEDLFFFARENLMALSDSLELQVLTGPDQEPKAVIIATGDSHDASRVVLPSLHEKLSEVLGPDMLVGIPNRDFMIVVKADEEELVANVSAQVKLDAQSRPYPISGRMFRLTSDGITLQ